MRICSIKGCGEKHFCKGLCPKHFALTPERKSYQKARQQTPEYKAKNAALRHTPEYKAREAARRATPEYRTKEAARRATPEYQDYQDAYHTNPEAKAKKANYDADPENRIRRNDRQAIRYATDPIFHCKCTIYNLMYDAFIKKCFSKESKTLEILGCSFEEAMISIGWFPGCEIHHIVPMETAATIEDVIRLNHYTNLIALTHERHKEVHRHMKGLQTKYSMKDHND